MDDIKQLQELVDKVTSMYGCKADAAKALEVTERTLTNWNNGKGLTRSWQVKAIISYLLSHIKTHCRRKKFRTAMGNCTHIANT